jgi:tRNA (cytidine/uridine-2'-O-)-methyltransferase
VATGCALHLIRPLGFDTSVKACRRAGLDYWERLDVREHAGWDEYESATPGARRWLLSTKGRRSVFDVDLMPGDHLVFGSETRGLPPDLLSRHEASMIGLPMVRGVRSLNVATAVCAVVYEGVRQCLARGEVAVLDGFCSVPKTR